MNTDPVRAYGPPIVLPNVIVLLAQPICSLISRSPPLSYAQYPYLKNEAKNSRKSFGTHGTYRAPPPCLTHTIHILRIKNEADSSRNSNQCNQ